MNPKILNYKMILKALFVYGLICFIFQYLTILTYNFINRHQRMKNKLAYNKISQNVFTTKYPEDSSQVLSYIYKYLNRSLVKNGKKQVFRSFQLPPKHQNQDLHYHRLCLEPRLAHYPLKACVQNLTAISYASPNRPKILVHWTRLDGRERLGIRYGNNNFAQCPISNCLFVPDHPMYVGLADALLWSPMNSYTYVPYPPPSVEQLHDSAIYASNMKRGSGRQQLWVFAVWEPPVNLKMPRNSLSGMDLVMTYMKRSDVYMPWGSIVPKSRSADQTLPSVNNGPHDNTTDNDFTREATADIPRYEDKTDWDRLIAKARKPGGKAVWFVSNCGAKSRRDDIVRELARYLPVHVYGTCGNYTCPKKKRITCLSSLGPGYKFYLSFENALCRDYVTEKLFYPLTTDILPVVYGIGHYLADDLFPPGVRAFVDVLNFPTVKELAAYLLWLDKTPEAYLSYFGWKEKYKVIKPNHWCALCQKLNDPKAYALSRKPPYGPLRDWFSRAECVSLPLYLFPQSGKGDNLIDLGVIKRAVKERFADMRI